MACMQLNLGRKKWSFFKFQHFRIIKKISMHSTIIAKILKGIEMKTTLKINIIINTKKIIVANTTTFHCSGINIIQWAELYNPLD